MTAAGGLGVGCAGFLATVPKVSKYDRMGQLIAVPIAKIRTMDTILAVTHVAFIPLMVGQTVLDSSI